ncbi:hypothetical protein L7F22_041225 [Adiantum nelumboides]|nr:hypothetical protein [Adiantum nelumboides]
MWRSASRRFFPSLRVGARALPSTAASGRAFEQSSWVAPFADHEYSRFQRCFSAQPPAQAPPPEKKLVTNLEELPKVEVVISDEPDPEFGIATGFELQELLAEKEGKKLFDLEPPRGPFGTKEYCAGKAVSNIRQLVAHAKVRYHITKDKLVLEDPMTTLAPQSNSSRT